MPAADGRAGFAGAKVNLYLHVGPLAADGYHPIDSLMVFADVGDRLVLQRAAETSATAEGPFAAAAPMTEANLAVRAVRSVLARSSDPNAAFHLLLEKRLPVAAGIGGGSADAAAALHLARAAFAPELDDGVLHALGLSLGADVPACLESRALIARGRGELLASAPRLPALHAVLVNPGVPTPTGPIFAAFDAAPSPAEPLDPQVPAGFDDVRQLVDWLTAQTRNDLQPAARSLVPAVGEALDLLADLPSALLARMSGSGATVFALCADAQSAAGLAKALQARRPAWWIAACRLA